MAGSNRTSLLQSVGAAERGGGEEEGELSCLWAADCNGNHYKLNRGSELQKKLTIIIGFDAVTVDGGDDGEVGSRVGARLSHHLPSDSR